METDPPRPPCRVVVVDNHDSYTHNLYQLVWSVTGDEPDVVANDVVSVDQVLSAGYTHVVVSPGPGSPNRPEDLGVCRELLRRVDIPCLGVCLGHQAIASVFGGRVGPAPEVVHGHQSRVWHDGSALFAGIPSGFHAVRYHSLAVHRPLPAPLTVTAWTGDGVVMGLAHRTRPLVGVQFHPESVLTEHGARLVANFLALPAGTTCGGGRGTEPGGRGTEPGTARFAVPAPRPSPSPRPAAPVLGGAPPGGAVPRPRGPGGRSVFWRHLPGRFDPEVVFAEWYRVRPYAFWLDSARSAHGMGGFSFMGAASVADPPEPAGRGRPDPVRPAGGAAGRAPLLRSWDGGRSTAITDRSGTRQLATPLFEMLAEVLAAHSTPAGDAPVPFVGGYVGYLGYGMKASTGCGKGGGGRRPDAEMMWVDRLVAFDHHTGDTYLVALDPDPGTATAWLEASSASLAALEGRVLPPPGPPDAVVRAEAGVDRRTFGAHLATIEGWLRSGDTYEACYTYQVRGRDTQDPWMVYRRLRRTGPAPYGAYLRFGDRHVLSCSPERFVTVDADGGVETRPIKGTAPRGATPGEDARLAEGLARGAKTRAENLMIADLLRNDLGRVCLPGSVVVPQLMGVESYATVHQLVTRVRGRLRPGVGAVGCLAALFPGGSMTGAPKRRTVELLDQLEPVERGVYSGCLGYFGVDGRADHSVVIRTVVREGDRFSIGVGGAITIASDPEEEYAETRLKAEALLAAVGATVATAVRSQPRGPAAG